MPPGISKYTKTDNFPIISLALPSQAKPTVQLFAVKQYRKEGRKEGGLNFYLREVGVSGEKDVFWL